MANTSGLSGVTSTVGALSSVALVIPSIAGLFGSKSDPKNTIGYQPQNPSPTSFSLTQLVAPSQPALLFHYEGEQSVTLESDITDHFIEDNTAIQDQIALKPEKITTHGFIGELNDVPPNFLGFLGGILNRLTPLGAYAPGISTTAQNSLNTANQLYQTGATAVNSVVSAVNSLSGGGGLSVINGVSIQKVSNQNKQQSMFQQFYGYWLNRTLFTVQTPWAVFQNMAIQSLRAIQDADTQVITDFEITFKLIRIASTISNLPLTSGRFSLQSALGVSNGSQTPLSGGSLTFGSGGGF